MIKNKSKLTHLQTLNSFPVIGEEKYKSKSAEKTHGKRSYLDYLQELPDLTPHKRIQNKLQICERGSGVKERKPEYTNHSTKNMHGVTGKFGNVRKSMDSLTISKSGKKLNKSEIKLNLRS